MIKRIKEALKTFFLFLKSVVYNFNQDKCKLHAAALSFITILTLIPFLALIFAISKGLGIQNYFQDIVIHKIALGKQDIFLKILQYIENTNLKNLGTVGIVVLLLAMVRLLGSIEEVFNAVWNVDSARRITRKISDYLTIVVLCPIFVFVTFTFTASLSSNALIQSLLQNDLLNNVYLNFIRFLPFISIWMALSIFYMFMPNIKVNLTSGVISGIIAGTIWQIFQWAYIQFQIGITKYNAIYGTFASVPIFIVWIYFSWVVILYGAELGFVFQNRKNLKDISGKDEDSLLEFNELYNFLKFIVQRFQDGKFPLDYEIILSEFNLQKSKIVRLINYLEQHKILKKKENELYFIKNPCNIKLTEVFLPQEIHSDSKQATQIMQGILNREELQKHTLTDII
ncbi:MAG: YihY/virulence factor BrkB family protein [Candidatus Kaelpia aquatica]|nr:YihY/virulence factor BrkB family protein [Candidatus Kaelpia aquatica]